MTYKILETKTQGEIVITVVEYNFGNDTIVTVDVAHFMPKDVAEIEQSILNRAASEKTKLDAAALNETLIQDIIIGEEKPIE
jgi:hypothetical protein